MLEIIDAHAHIYPSKIAFKASKAIGDFYGIEMRYGGTTDLLLEEGKKAGVTKFLVHSCATTAHQVHSINEYILKEMNKHDEFIGFMTLHQDMSKEEIEKEVSWAMENNFKGIKLHPDFQKFKIDDPDVYKIYEVASGKLPILFHTGDKRYEYSSPKRLVKVANDFPNLNVIGAHFGGYSCWDEIEVYKEAKYNNIYFDTSSSLDFISKEKAKEMIMEFGVDRFFFGTDYPMWDATEEIARFMKLDLSDEEREKILALNIKKLLKI